MAGIPPRGSGIFSGLVLIIMGVLFLLHNYRGYELRGVLLHWWPLILIFWGVIKLYERTMPGRAQEAGAARVSGGEILLILGLLALMGIVISVDAVKHKIPDMDLDFGSFGRNSFNYDLEVEPKKVPANARINIRAGRGDINVRASDSAQIRVSGKKNVRSWNESEAQRLSESASVEIVQNGDAYEIRPKGFDIGDTRVGMDLDIDVPAKATLNVVSRKGNISISDMSSPVTVSNQNGNVEVRNIGGDVSIDIHRGDVKVSDVKGDVKISGKGGEIETVNASGGLTLDGEFHGPIRADKVAKGVRFVSGRSDLTITQLSGHMELSSGNLEITDAPGNLFVRTNRYDVSIEKAGGKMKVDNRDGNINVRFSTAPKEDIELNDSNATISLSMPGTSSFEIVADCHSCEIDSDFSGDGLKKTSTESGDSHLEGKYGTKRGPKIILKTSYGTISLHKTSSEAAPPSPPRVPAPPEPGAATTSSVTESLSRQAA